LTITRAWRVSAGGSALRAPAGCATASRGAAASSDDTSAASANGTPARRERQRSIVIVFARG